MRAEVSSYRLRIREKGYSIASPFENMDRCTLVEHVLMQIVGPMYLQIVLECSILRLDFSLFFSVKLGTSKCYRKKDNENAGESSH